MESIQELNQFEQPNKQDDAYDESKKNKLKKNLKSIINKNNQKSIDVILEMEEISKMNDSKSHGQSKDDFHYSASVIKPNDYLFFSIFNTIFCIFPIGNTHA